MRHGIFATVLSIVLASSWAVAADKGRSGGGGQGHPARSHGSSAHTSSASRPHTQAFSAPKPRAQNAARPSATAQPNHALATPGTVSAGSSVGGTLSNAFSNSTSAPAATGTTVQKPMTAAATSLLPAMMYGSMVPFGSSPGLALYHGYRASRNPYGYGRGNRGYGHRNSMVNNRMMHLSRLVRDLNTLRVGYAASPNDRNILRNDLMGVAQGGIRPPSPAVQQLSGGLISHLPTRRTAFMNTERLALDLEAVMNGGRLPPARVNQAINSAQSILRSSGVPQAGIQALSADLKAIGFWRAAGNQAGFVR